MLLALGVRRARLLSNNPDKAEQLGRHGVVITERIPTEVHLSKDNGRYLAAKAAHRAHTIALPLAE
jgi:GTP cyclohydrolase II